MLSSLKDHSFTLLLSQFTNSFYLRSKHLCQLCALILTCLPIALVILLCVDNYPWDIHVTSWKHLLKLNHPLCCFNAFYYEFISYELALMQLLLILVLKVLFMKSFAIWFICLVIIFVSNLLFRSLHSSHMLYNNVDQGYVGSMSLQKLFVLSFTYSRTSRN